MNKLSERALLLLRIIDEATVRDGDGELKRYFVPNSDGHCFAGERHFISDAGDARILISLEAKGLTKQMPKIRYSYAITPLGKEKLREK